MSPEPPKFAKAVSPRDYLALGRYYPRGAPSPLVRQFKTNPHIVVRALRAQLYRELLGPGGAPIREFFPVWNEDYYAAEFEEERVSIPLERDENMMAMLEDYQAALEHFFPREAVGICPTGVDQNQWEKHLHGCRSIVIELHCWLMNKDEINVSYLEEMLKFESG